MKRDKILDDAEELLKSDITKTNKTVYEALVSFLKFDTQGGKIVFDSKTIELINKAEKEIRKALNKSGYNSRVSQYLRDFDKIKQATIAQQKSVNRVDVSTRLVNNIQKSAIQQTTNILLGNGLDFNFIQPVKDVLLNAASSGMSIAQAELQLRQVILGNRQQFGHLERYVNSMSREIIGNYDGMLQSRIAKEYELDGYSFEGSIIATSAGQCLKWSEMGELPIKDMDKELDWARENQGSTYGGLRILALQQGTTKDTFPILKSHYGCRHTITAIRL